MKKLMNKIIWMPYYRAWRLLVLCLILFMVCSYSIIFPENGYPAYNNCNEYEGIIEQFTQKKNQTNLYCSLKLQNSKTFYINNPLMEAFDWGGALKDIKQGDYVEILALNEKDGAYGPRLMALSKDGQSYLTYEQAKSVYQDIEMESRKWVMMVLSALVFILLYLSIDLVVQLLIIRKIGKPIAGNEWKMDIFHTFRSFVPCLFAISAIFLTIGGASRYEEWKGKIDYLSEQGYVSTDESVHRIEIQDKESYLLEEIKLSRDISLWYFGAVVSGLSVTIPILLKRKKEGARANP